MQQMGEGEAREMTAGWLDGRVSVYIWAGVERWHVCMYTSALVMVCEDMRPCLED